jgi:hypothetical protein
MLRTCDLQGCDTLTLGSLCAQHEPPVRGSFGRGRPFRAERLETAGTLINALSETTGAAKAHDEPD